MFANALRLGSGLATLLVCAALPYGARSVAAETEWNNSSDPNAPYGLCSPGGSALRSKFELLYELGETLDGVLAITVLECGPFGGGAPAKVPCPAGTPYAYCTRHPNDGAGNDVTLGILKLDAKSDPNGRYTGCAAGAPTGSKLRLIRLAGLDPRRIKGIVTLACGPAERPAQTMPRLVSCPAGPDPYGRYCLNTPNDGLGNAVTLGVVAANSPGDPHALYGECVEAPFDVGIRPGFRSKATLVTGAGRSMSNVRSIDLIVCNQPGAMSRDMPTDIEATRCETIPFIPPGTYARRYDYCIWGTDARGNGVFAGVNGR